MKKFQFSLQALQILRERQEQFALQEYREARNAWEQAQQIAAATRSELEAAWKQRQQKLLAGCPALDLEQLQGYCQSLQQQSEAADSVAQATQNKASQAVAKLLAARQARAVVDKFFASQKRRHERARRRAEQHSLDEIVNQRNALNTAIAGHNNQPLWN